MNDQLPNQEGGPTNRFRFGLSWMFVFVAFVAVASLWLATRYELRRQERRHERFMIQDKIDLLTIDKRRGMESGIEQRGSENGPFDAESVKYYDRAIAEAQEELRKLGD